MPSGVRRHIYIYINIYIRNLKFAQLVTALAPLANYYKLYSSIGLTVELVGSLQVSVLGVQLQSFPEYGSPVSGSVRHRQPSHVHSPRDDPEHLSPPIPNGQ